MAFPQSTRAWVNPWKPEAWAICDRCGFRYLHRELRFQHDWRGNQLQNLRILVCRTCEDVPFDLNRPIIIGPDPVPVKDPRPGWYANQGAGSGPEGPIAPPSPPEFVLDESDLDGPDVLG